MKNFLQFVSMFLLLITLLLVPFYSFAVPVVEIAAPADLWIFLQENWELVALFFSELLAVFAVKNTGLIKIVLNLLGRYVNKKAKKVS